jgi:hypothetical protein
MKCHKTLHDRYPFKKHQNRNVTLLSQLTHTKKVQYVMISNLSLKYIKEWIIKNIYPKLGHVNKSIGYIEHTSFTNLKWIHKDVIVHPPINVLINFNDFIENNINLQNIKLEGLPLKCHTNNTHIKEFPISPSHIGLKHLQNIHNQ